MYDPDDHEPTAVATLPEAGAVEPDVEPGVEPDVDVARTCGLRADPSADGPVLVGIDPGAETGVAVWSPRRGALLRVASGSFWSVVDLLWQDTLPVGGVNSVKTHLFGQPRWHVAGVVVEDPRGLPIYARNRGFGRGAADRIARSVGRIDRDVELWATWLRAQGYAVRLSEPQKRTKWDAADLARYTGWTASTNEHGRDAARLVVGLSASCPSTWERP